MSLLEDKKQHYHYTTVESLDCSVSSGTSLVISGGWELRMKEWLVAQCGSQWSSQNISRDNQARRSLHPSPPQRRSFIAVFHGYLELFGSYTFSQEHR